MDKFIALGTASESGVFYDVGRGICDLVNKHRADRLVRCLAYITGGSVFNIQAILSRELDMGLTSADLAVQAFEGNGEFADTGPSADLRTVAAFYDMPITMMARKESAIAKLEEFKGKRINIGNKGAGKRAAANLIFEVLGWKPSDFDAVLELPTQAAGVEFCARRLDIMIDVLGNPSSFYQEMISQCDGVMISMPADVVAKIVGKYPYFYPFQVPGDTYRGAPEPTSTFASKAILVTRGEIHQDTVYRFVKSMFEDLPALRAKHPSLDAVTPAPGTLKSLVVPVHAGADRFYGEQPSQ